MTPLGWLGHKTSTQKNCQRQVQKIVKKKKWSVGDKSHLKPTLKKVKTWRFKQINMGVCLGQMIGLCVCAIKSVLSLHSNVNSRISFVHSAVCLRNIWVNCTDLVVFQMLLLGLFFFKKREHIIISYINFYWQTSMATFLPLTVIVLQNFKMSPERKEGGHLCPDLGTALPVYS